MNSIATDSQFSCSCCFEYFGRFDKHFFASGTRLLFIKSGIGNDSNIRYGKSSLFFAPYLFEKIYNFFINKIS